MAGFLRKKTKAEPVSSKPAPTANTPLFARFGSSVTATATTTSSRAVSGPIALGKRDLKQDAKPNVNVAANSRRIITGPTARRPDDYPSPATSQYKRQEPAQGFDDKAFSLQNSAGSRAGKDKPLPPPGRDVEPDFSQHHRPSTRLNAPSPPLQARSPGQVPGSNNMPNRRLDTPASLTGSSTSILPSPVSPDSVNPLSPNDSSFRSRLADRSTSASRKSSQSQSARPSVPSPPPQRPESSMISAADAAFALMNLDEFDPIAADSSPQLAPKDIKPEYSQTTSSSLKMSATTTTTTTRANPAPSAYHMMGTPRKSSSQRSVVPPARGKPLIFTAMTTIPSEAPPAAYPSPPAEYYHSPQTQTRNFPSSHHHHVAPIPQLFARPSSQNNVLPQLRQEPPQTPPKAPSIQGRPHTPSRSPSDATVSPTGNPVRRLTKHRPTTPVSMNQETHSKPTVDMPYFSDDPFAKAEGVKMLPPNPSPKPPKVKSLEEDLHTEAIPIPEERPITPPPPPPPCTAPPTPPSPEEYKRFRRGHVLEKSPPKVLASLPVKEDRPPEPFPLHLFLGHATILCVLLPYLSYYEWLVLSSTTKKIRDMLEDRDTFGEVILERFLKTVGYSKWLWGSEPLSLSLDDLYNYMWGVTLPTHEYARTAQCIVQTHPSQRDPALVERRKQMTDATRAYTRVVLRLRAQAEKEVSKESRSASRARSRASSRAPSPTFSQSTHGGGHRAVTPVSHGFKSPLFRLRRAPLLRCFVPSPDGDWLSDASVLECEAELKRAGVIHLLRVGDVVWDIAVGDEGNVGRLVWDGSYLIDLDYTYSAVGDLPKYLPTIAFSPSYFHRVIRTGPSSNNPIVRLDLAPWGEEVAANLQLLQDRVRTETPQGTYHNVVRWVHRSSFVIRPHSRTHSRIPIPDSNGMFVDPGWYGTVVVETEGTNESLADLQDRCGPGAFPPRVAKVAGSSKDKDSKMVFRILRERSRPAEIWLRCVSPKERIN